MLQEIWYFLQIFKKKEDFVKSEVPEGPLEGGAGLACWTQFKYLSEIKQILKNICPTLFKHFFKNSLAPKQLKLEA